MKKLLLTVAMLLGIFNASLAQTTVYNTTACPIQVRQACYDAACNLVSVTSTTVAPASSAVLAPPCNPGEYRVFHMCTVPTLCPGTSSNCMIVDGTQSGISPCGPGTYSDNQLATCVPCTLTGNNMLYMTYDPTLDELHIVL